MLGVCSLCLQTHNTWKNVPSCLQTHRWSAFLCRGKLCVKENLPQCILEKSPGLPGKKTTSGEGVISVGESSQSTHPSGKVLEVVEVSRAKSTWLNAFNLLWVSERGLEKSV